MSGLDRISTIGMVMISRYFCIIWEAYWTIAHHHIPIVRHYLR